MSMARNADHPQSLYQKEHAQDTACKRFRPAPVGHLPLTVSEFQGMTLCNMQVLFPDAAAAARAVQALGLVPKQDCSSPPPCPKCGGSICKRASMLTKWRHLAHSHIRCGGPTRARADEKNKFGFRFTCRNVKTKKIRRNWRRGKITRVQTCTGSVTPAHNTFFDQVRTSTLQILQLMYCWVANFPVTQAAAETRVSPKTAIDFYDDCQEVAEIVVSNMPFKIGGPGMHVEVNETYTKHKEDQRVFGTDGHQIVIFGAYCCETKEGLIWHVPSKSRHVLWAYMENYIEPGSIIVLGAELQYLECVPSSGHKVINHSACGSRRKARDTGDKGPASRRKITATRTRFVDSADSQTRAKNIEIHNRYMKANVKSLQTDRTLQQYLCEYTYRNRILSVHREIWERFLRFADDVAAVYPGPGRDGLQLLEIDIPDDVASGKPLFQIEVRDEDSNSDTTLDELKSPKRVQQKSTAQPPRRIQQKSMAQPLGRRKRQSPEKLPRCLPRKSAVLKKILANRKSIVDRIAS